MQAVDALHQPLILYTDASDVPERTPRFVVGAVIFDPESNTLEHTYMGRPRRGGQPLASKINLYGTARDFSRTLSYIHLAQFNL